ncbi:unnamed protein product [Blepharisma stoltei]|uniref:Uncharacterized protein n=1 Tax=Blepharisma stoltei TaxID=1481888 RepID=A0AAU9K1B4_9CILI|nr:unnamed protein product [Blepharisma stoltei]
MSQSTTLDFLRPKLAILIQIKKRQLQRAYLKWYNEALRKVMAEKHGKLKAYTLKLLNKRSPVRPSKVGLKSVKFPEALESEEIDAPALIYTDRLKISPTEKQLLINTFDISKENKHDSALSTKASTPDNKHYIKRNSSAPSKSPKNLFDKIRNDLQQKASRPDTPTDQKPIEIGERLFRHAEIINKKKEILRNSNKINYPFSPKISDSTNKWLIKREYRINKPKEDPIAIVSCAEAMSDRVSRLGFLRTMNPNFNLIEQNEDLVENYPPSSYDERYI